MRLVSAQNGRLITTDADLASAWSTTDRPRGFFTGLTALDELLPPAGLMRSAVHELLHEPTYPPPRFFALVLAYAATQGQYDDSPSRFENHTSRSPVNSQQSRRIVWCDPSRTLYPPAVFAAGIRPQDLWILYPNDQAEAMWSIAECMRCRGVGATIAHLPLPALWEGAGGRARGGDNSNANRFDRRDARRLQLAAERGGGIGLLIRRRDHDADIYAAATRWLVAPCAGERTAQRWRITLLHGHGGQVGSSFLLEHRRDQLQRENNLVHSFKELADRPRETRTVRWA